MRINYKHSEETRKKMSISAKGRFNNLKPRLGCIPWNKGMKLSSRTEEVKKKISQKNKLIVKSLEWRQKISKSLIGKKHSQETIIKMSGKNNHRYGKVSWNSGKKNVYSDKTLEKMSKSHQGEKSYRWLGGKSFEPYPIEFNNYLKKEVKKRDRYTCQICRRIPDILHIHHIDYNKNNCQVNNLIALCRNCHCKTNTNREQWVEYFNRGNIPILI